MEKLSIKTSFLALSILMASNTAVAQNPIVTHCYTADPAPMVFEGNDSLYVYCDEDMNIPGVHDFYYMDRYRVYSTVDMVNWTDHGIAMLNTKQVVLIRLAFSQEHLQANPAMGYSLKKTLFATVHHTRQIRRSAST